MKATVKVQANKSNTWVNIPKEIREILDIKKGDTLLLEVKDGKIIIGK